MKLYFYHLSQPLGEKPRIEVEECRVEEKSRSYQPIEDVPSFYFCCYIMKDETGNLTGKNRDLIILAEKDNAKAAEIFKEKLHDDIKQNQERIESLKKEVAKAYDLIDMVDDWRLENETH